MNVSQEPFELLRCKLNLETGRVGWKELERFFASGLILSVAPELDLVEAALQFTLDNKRQCERWLADGSVRRASDAEAMAWHAEGKALWAVVVRPWVLVQDRLPADPVSTATP